MAKKKKSLSQQEVLQKLEISNFSEMSDDKIPQFTEMIPEMEPNVAKTALQLFPHFAKTATTVMNCFKDISLSAMKDNAENAKSLMATCDTVIESLKPLLQQEDLSFEDKQKVVDNMLKVLQMKAEMDKDNKAWLTKLAIGTGAVVVTVVGIAAAVLGNKDK